MAATNRLLITCEHGGNRIPARYRHFFRDRGELLATHRGYDAGALALATEMAEALEAPLFVSTTSRLLIDLNRSIGHRRLFSEGTRHLPASVRREILESCYLPYRDGVEGDISEALAHGSRVIHVSCHSFTPELDGQLRDCDVGLLYDPQRSGELALCRRWQDTLRAVAPGLRVRRNYPYTGKADGFTAHLRGRFSADLYVGVELEINQKHVSSGGRRWRALRRLVIESLRQALEDH